jgi:hypothetical protein
MAGKTVRWVLVLGVVCTWLPWARIGAETASAEEAKQSGPLKFDLKSVKDGPWSSPETWQPQRLPKQGDRVQIARGTRVVYDAASPEVIRLVQVIGTLSFARDRDTLLNVGILKVQNSDACSESGFACDFWM